MKNPRYKHGLSVIKYSEVEGLCAPADGGWSEWSWPGECFEKSDSRTEKVTQTKRRYCNSPEPQHGGQNCTGEETGETRECYSFPGEGELELTSMNLNEMTE